MRIIKCNQCGSQDIKKSGRNTWRVIDKEKHQRRKAQRFQCNVCGKIFEVLDNYERIFILKNGEIEQNKGGNKRAKSG